VNGDHGIGFAVAERAMTLAIGVAQEQGVGIALVRNSNHFGRGAPYAQQAVDAGMIGVALSNASATVAVWGGREPEIGTNPIACAVPVAGEQDFSFDMATTAIARGRLRRAAEAGEAVDPGVAIRRDGEPALTAAEAMAGVLLPFGLHKGSNIALLVEVLAGVLPGAAVGREVRAMFMDTDQPAGTGHFLMAIDVAAVMPRAAFEARMATWLEQLRARSPASCGFRLPGDRAAETTRDRLRDGVPLSTASARALDDLADALTIARPARMR
jgi:LDH2 family malate/lactate/ureidoglycolate dehydrogenase